MNGKRIFLILGVVCAFTLKGQTVIGSGTVSGTVRDYTRSGIPDTSIVVSNGKLGVKRTLITTDDGLFNGPSLPPGTGYDLKVTRKGFLDVDYKDFEILVGHTLYFRISMAQDAAKQEENQKASIDVEDLTFASGTAFSESEIDALPSRDRDPNALAPLTPGVTRDSSTGVLAFRSEPATNAFLTDGILTTNTFYFNRTPLGPTITQEAVTEVQTVTAGAPVEFGQTMGGTIDVLTRAGGNALHGEAYEYFNSNAMNAPDRYGPGFSPSGSRHQFGGNAGGPTLSKNLFWFANAEYLDAHSQELNLSSNPLLVNPSGTSIAPANCTATAAQCAAAITFLNGQLNRVVDSSVSSFTGLVRVDWRPNQANLLTVEANAMHRHAPNGSNIETVSDNASLLGYNGTYTDESRYAKVGYTSNWSGNVLNEFRAGWYRDRFSDYNGNQLLPSTGALGIDIAGSQFGGNPNYPSALSEQRYQITDNWTFSAGTHSVKIGGDFMKTEDWNYQIINAAGSYVYPTLTAFAEDFSGNAALHKDYTIFNQTFGTPLVDLHIKNFDAYVQDTWSPYRKLKVVLGFRYEKPFLPQPTLDNAPYYQTGTISGPSIDASPRIGLAYQWNDRTVVRMGLGSYYQPFPGQLLDALFTGNAIYQFPVAATPNLTRAPTFPAAIGSSNNFPVGSTVLSYAVAKFRSPVSAQGVISIERQIGHTWTANLNYIYNRGLQLFSATDQNLVYPTLTETYAIQNAAGATVSNYSTLLFNAKTNTAVAHAYQIGNAGKSSFQGATLQIRKRMSHGLLMEASYTWSHAVDDVSGTATVAGFVPVSSSPGEFAADRGNSAFNQPNRGLIRWTYQPHFSGGDFSRHLLNGWQFSGTATLASGLGETPVVMVNGQQFTGQTMPFTNSLNGSGGWSRVPFEGVNSLSTGPQYVVDARLTRDIPITERVKGRLMFEAYNALNMQYNTSVNTIAYLATSGVLKPVSGFGQGNSADGYPWGDNARHLQIALRIVF